MSDATGATGPSTSASSAPAPAVQTQAAANRAGPDVPPEVQLASTSALATASQAPSPKKTARLADYPVMQPVQVPKQKVDSEAGDTDEEGAQRKAYIEEQDDDDDGATSQPEGDANDEGIEELLKDYDDDEESIDLTHLRLTSSSMRKLGISRFAKLQRLGLRQNEVDRLTEHDVGALHSLLDLDLYDNWLGKTYGEVLKGCPELVTLDLSFNSIRHISHLQHLSNLRTLYLVQNKIARVRFDDLRGPIASSLRSLEFGGNRLRSIENLDELSSLEELWLGKNKITKLENLSSLGSLRILSIQSNRITKLENLSSLVNLEELYISHNGLKRIEGLQDCLKLTTRDVGANQISEIEGLDGLRELEEFWANDNQIATLRDLEKKLGPNVMPKLATVYLEGNPAQRTEGSAYRRKVMLALPQLQQIDAVGVRR